MESFPISELYKRFLKSTGVCTDSRRIFENCIFWGIKGPNFNGNEFAEKALELGAQFAVVDELKKPDHPQLIYVEDSIKALQELANYHRRQFDIPIIAVTGSNGKTTTKELIAAVLSRTYCCHFTKGNFNNHLGVPLTLLKMTSNAEVAIIEMGANHQGEIKELCEIAEPTHGLITNIGKAHLEGFGGLEGVKKGKGELYEFLAKTKGVGFINKDENYLIDLSADIKYRRVYYGLLEGKEKWLRIEKLYSKNNFLKVGFWDERSKLFESNSHLIGNYNLPNLATAICLGLYFKVPEFEIIKGIEGYIPSSNRSQLVNFKGAEIIMDAYNANPSSVELALRNFDKIQGENKIVILGAMKELGEFEKKEHSRIADLAFSLDFEEIILIGKEFLNDAKKNKCKYFSDIALFKSSIENEFFGSKKILVKGSRSTQLEKLIEE